MMLIAALAISAVMFALTVDGYVTDIDTGEAIEGATVRFMLIEGGNCGGGCGGNAGNGGNGGNGGQNGNMGNGITVVTDASGYYVIEDLDAGIYNALARKPGSYASQHVYDLEISEDTSVDFELLGGNCVPPVERLLRSNK